MIVDSIDRLEKYASFFPSLKLVAGYIQSLDLSNFEEKKVEIDGKNIFVMHTLGKGKQANDALLEAHNTYADVQVCLGKGETFGFRDRATCSSMRGQFDEAKDIVFYDDKPTTYLTLANKEFVLFMPEDAHAPLIGEGEMPKLIFKVKV